MVTKRLPTGRQAFRLLVTVTCKALRDDKRSLLSTIRALNLAWYRTGLPACACLPVGRVGRVTLTVRLLFSI